MTGLLSVAGSTPSDSGFELKSVRFNIADSASLERTQVSGNRTTWTVSAWVKRGDIDSASNQYFLSTNGTSDNTFLGFYFKGGSGTPRDQLIITGYANAFLRSTQVFRDPSSWYHIVVQANTASVTASERLRVWVNGSEITDWAADYRSSMSSMNLALGESGRVLALGWETDGNANELAGYLSEVYCIDGQALTPSSFGETNALTNQWQPKNPTDIKPTLTFGTNGFYLPFSNDALAASFTDSSDPTAWTAPAGITSVDYLVVAGGGSGASRHGGTGVGGGGAGGMLTGTLTVVPGTVYTVTVGAGGAGVSNAEGNDGTDSVFSSITADGGGGGGGDTTGRNGGSAGGGSNGGSGGSGTAGQGNAGGSGGIGGGGGGGGGAGAVGANNSGTTGGNGGAGTASSITGASVTYAGGGGANASSGSDGSGGSGGGGAGSKTGNATAGTANTGGGGGGARAANTSGAGGSGIVVLDDGTTVTSFTSSRSDHTVTVGGTVINERISNYGTESQNQAHIIGPKVGSSAIAFHTDGGNYLEAPSSTDFDFGSGAFTLEGWYNITELDLTGDPGFALMGNRESGSPYEGWMMEFYSGVAYLYFHNGSNINVNWPWTPQLKRWYHLAFARSGNLIDFWIDGVSQGSQAITGTLTASTAGFKLGGQPNSVNYDFFGYADEQRISNVARYTPGTDFTPATTAFTSDSNTMLLIPGNGAMGSTSFDDLSPSDHTISVTGDVVHVAQKIGTGMAAFDGVDDTVTIRKEAGWLYYSDFTIEGWWYLTASGSAILTEQGTNSTNAFQIWNNASNKLQIYLDSDGSAWDFNTTSTTAFPQNAWNHVALVRSGNNIRLYVNGTLDSAFASSTFSGKLNASSSWVYIAMARTGSGDFKGYVDEYRISQTARYTSNFTPSTTAFKDDKDTRVLLHMDGGGGIDPVTNLPILVGQGNYFWDAANNAIFYGADGLATQKSMIDIGGGTNYLKAPSSEDWDFGTGEFTMEMWMNTNDAWPASESGLIANHNGSGWQWIIDGENSDSTVKYDFWATDGTEYNSAIFTINPLEWQHMAVTRQNNNLYYYIDGINIGTNAFVETMGDTACELVTFAYRDNGAGAIRSGNFDQIRVSNTCRYPGEFTASVTEFASDANTVLLLHCDGANDGTTFTDSSGTPHTVTANGGAHTDTAIKKIGTASAQFDGSGAYLSIPDSPDWDLITGDENWTIEFWVYPTQTESSSVALINHAAGGGVGWNVNWDGSGKARIYNALNGSGGVTTSSVIANNQWTHVAFQYNAKNSWLRVYVNGILDNTAQNAVSWSVAGAYALYIGAQDTGSLIREFTGYLDEIRISTVERYGNFTPPTALFEADANTKLLIQSDFSEGGLGADHSNNYNYFTPTNLTDNDMMLDSPMNTVGGNFCTWNPLWGRTGKMPVLSEGNLVGASSDAAQTPISATFGNLVDGKWYWEIEIKAKGGSDCKIGIVNTSGKMSDVNQSNHYYRLYLADTGNKFSDTNASTVAYGNTYAAGDIVGIALDMDNGALYFAKNGTWQTSGDPTSGATKTGAAYTDVLSAVPAGGKGGGDGWVPYVDASDTTVRYAANFGADSSFAGEKTAQGNQDGNKKGDFYYAPPAGYLALCTDNLADPLISGVDAPLNFNTATYAGTGASQTIAVGFQPDFVWAKSDNTAVSNVLYDSARGTGRLESNTTAAEASRDGFVGFSSNGFDVDDDGGGGGINYPSGRTYVAWNWKAGGAPTADNSAGAGAVPTAGSVKIDGSNLGSALAGTLAATRISANTTAGMSVVSYTGIFSNATVGHGLSVAPEFIFIKNRSSVLEWKVYNATIGNTKVLYLDATDSAQTGATSWNDTSPSASVFTIGANTGVNEDTSLFVAYCFHSVEGYSKVGSYTGNNNADGTFVYTGFKPAYIMFKRYDSAESWGLYDDKRPGYNVTPNRLYADSNAAQVTTSTSQIDMLSNGFKARSTGGVVNAAGDYLYLAFAESPFKTSNAR